MPGPFEITREQIDIAVDLPEIGFAFCDSIEKMQPEQLGEPEINFLERVSKAVPNDLKLRAVKQLGTIVSVEEYKKGWRLAAVKSLKDVLTAENEILVRMEALRVFQKKNDLFDCEEVRNITHWLSNQQTINKNKTILLSDDDIMRSECMIDFLKYGGFENILYERDPFETLDVVKRVKPDLIITDMSKPRINGFEMAQAIKSNPELEHIPILLLSALYFEKDPTHDIFCATMTLPQSLERILLLVNTILAGNYTSNKK